MGLRFLSATIDADGSPSGHIAWYNHSTETGKIRTLRPVAKNDKCGVQRMEMLAIYFALSDNQQQIIKIVSSQSKNHLIVNIRSDSKTTIEQLQGISEIRDKALQKIFMAIKKLAEKMMIYMTINFHHLERARNIAGLLLEQRKRKEEEKFLIHRYDKYYYNRFMLPDNCIIT
jgi:hypothetical protein